MNKFQPSLNINLTSLIICFLPISIVLGNLILNLNIFILIFLYLFETFKNSNLKVFLINKNMLLIFITLFFIFNLIDSVNWKFTLKGQIGLIKNILLYFALIYFFFKDDKNFKLFINILVFVLIFVLADSYIQFIFGKDLFGYVVTDNHGRRLSGPFGDEYVVGSFILKTIFITKYHKYLDNKINWLIYLILAYILVIFASQRMPTLIFSISLIILFFFEHRINIKTKIFTFLVSIICILIIFNFNSSIKKHYIDRTLEQIGYSDKVKSKNFWDSQWGAHYLTAIEIYKDNPIFGSGIKTFRFICAKKKYEKIESKMAKKRCSTHPHNIYLEILSETGTLGFLSFFLILIYFFKINKVFTKKNIKSNPEILILLFICFWPIQSTGSVFSTWNGLFYPLTLSYICYVSKKKISSTRNI